ncbi:chemotaxis protein MotB [Dissulfurispira thermophila]|uniref:Chemotaxis protein MotB n=2 Tax=root TaxID=1 RepID=A0A7G1H1J4_9BACT|nr:OmpA family protein [Dissulfurispira thermophila]BCB96092.1 chemotaxis protein MotB [Dissulfurispira thermophila]
MRKRRKTHFERPSHERWLISYADFITLMFTFFAALYALSSVDKAKVESFSGSLKHAFKVMEEPIPLYEERTKMLVQDISKSIQGIEGISVKTDPRGVVVTFSDAVLFASGSADIKSEVFNALDKISKVIKDVPGRITIEGHTDNVPVSGGKYTSNWELSTARAASILHFFIQKGGLDPNRFSIAGYGEYRPVASNETEDGRAKNRRVELVISGSQ